MEFNLYLTEMEFKPLFVPANPRGRVTFLNLIALDHIQVFMV